MFGRGPQLVFARSGSSAATGAADQRTSFGLRAASIRVHLESLPERVAIEQPSAPLTCVIQAIVATIQGGTDSRGRA